MKRAGTWLAIAVLIAVAGFVFLDPTQKILGKLLGDATFDAYPTRYWAWALQADPATQADALTRLQQPAAVPVLVELVRDYSGAESVELRCKAVEILGKLGPDAAAAAPVLIDAARGPDAFVQAVSIGAIPKVGVSAEIAVPVLTEQLRSENNVVAARTISEYRGMAAPALPELVKLLQDTSQSVEARWNAARTIGKIGPAANSAVPVLIEMTRSPEPTIREHATEAIGDIGPVVNEEAIDALVQSLTDTAPRVRRDAVRSLGYIGPKAKHTAPAIQKLIEDPEKMVQEAARNALKAVTASEP